MSSLTKCRADAGRTGTRGLSIAQGLIVIIFAFAVLYDGNPVLTLGCLVLLALTSLLLIWPKLMGEPFNWSKAHWFLVAYLVWQSALVFFSIVPENTLLAYGVWVSLVVVTLALSGLEDSVWRKIFGLFLVAGLVTASWGILEAVVTGIRADGPIVDPNAWAALNNLFFFMVLAVYLTVPRLRLLSLVALAIFASAVFASYSRAGFIVFTSGLSLVVLLTWRLAGFKRPLLMLLAILVVSYTLLNQSAMVQSSPIEKLTISNVNSGWNERFSMWKAALNIAADHPVVGVGPATFNLHYPVYHEPADMGTYGYFVHNDYLQFLAEGGPLLLLFLLTFTGMLIVALFRSGWQVMHGDHRQVEPLVLVVGMGAILIQALVNFPLYLIQIQMLMGLAFARWLTLQGYLYQSNVTLSSPRLVKVGVAFIALWVMSVAVLDGIGFDVDYQRSLPLVRDIRDNPQAYHQTMTWLRRLRSGNSRNHLAVAGIYRDRLNAEADPRARQSLLIAVALEDQAALQLNPYHSNARIDLARLLEAYPKMINLDPITHTAAELYQTGVTLWPTDVVLQLAYIGYLERHNQADAAYALLTGDGLQWLNFRGHLYDEQRGLWCDLLIARATARGDKSALERMLTIVGFERVNESIERSKRRSENSPG